MRNLVVSAFIGMMCLVSLPATAADCGKEFNGQWVLAERYHSNQFGYYTFSYVYNSHVGKAVMIEWDSQTARGGFPLGSGMPGRKGVRILHMVNSLSDGNLAVRSLGRGKCELLFTGPPRVPVDKYGAASRNISRKARLTHNGRTMTWCWVESGHMAGDCKTYEFQR